ncbi:bromodomain-containing protein 8-like isoform X2 [Leguminivora glycinivorella]|uniref:bromodomain-containing protein 8-like isoform X2 n=1 Tax=Leguminivora glycinivorella TaxID=1035111 RepID=UPI00200DF8F2|nr:bromodomain-containing protein 8-like isoform X2 [Leguminivora glycinivorella]
MSSIQERLQLKRIPLDTWNVREQLCLASAVVRSGDQNWMSVSRALKTVGEPNRPADWYSQKSCAAQYGVLLEHVETPKRKKRSSEGAVETPQESILKKLTQERIAEIQEAVAEMNRQYEQLKNEINEVRNPATSEDRVRELWTAIETSKRARERETAKRAAWLKEREERRARAERTWRPPAQTNQSAPSTPPPPSSPLLTSLLKSSPVVTTPQHIPHPATVVETISPSAGAPTLSMLLEKPGSTSPHDNKHAAIEHIKSQLVQIEQQLKASTTVPSPVPLPVPAVDIDDIEIKAEDVYAFRDIDLHIPPVATMHKGPVRAVEKPPFKKDEEETPMVTEEIKIENDPAPIEVQPVEEEKVPEEIHVEEITVTEEPVPEVQPQEEPAPQPEEVKIAFPEVKFPTPEIKIIHPEVQKPKEEVKEPEAPPPEVEPEVVVEDVPEVVEEVATEVVEETIVPPSPPPLPAPEEAPPFPPLPPPPPPEDPEPEAVPEVTDLDSIPMPSDPPPEDSIIELPPEQPPHPPLPELQPEESIENIAEEVKAASGLVQEVKEAQEDQEKDEDAEATEVASATLPVPQDSIPLKDMIKEEAEGPKEDGEQLEPHADTDDDTPMEVRMLSREEEKDGKKKRDYSRKKKSDSRTCSGSESAAEASAPDSPHANDAERQHRLWKRSVMLVYSRLCAHKYASLFLRPITDEEAPGYSVVVKRPMDLTTIKRNIEAGNIRTTAEFQRDILLMLSNALMYNSSEHSVYQMAKELHEEAVSQLGMLLAAQAHAGLAECAPRRKRRRADSPQQHKRPHH